MAERQGVLRIPAPIYDHFLGLLEHKALLNYAFPYPVPSLKIGEERVGVAEVDLMETVKPWLQKEVLAGSVRSFDVNDGCIDPCGTCVYDSRFPTRRWSLASVEKAFADGSFINLLQPDSLRVGNTAEPTDHPQIVALTEIFLQGTEKLDYQRMQEEGRHHQVKLIISYRKQKEEKINDLAELCQKYPERLTVIMALPRNRDPQVNNDFRSFAQNHWLFKGRLAEEEEGWVEMANGEEKTNLNNFLVNNVRSRRAEIFIFGRVLREERIIPGTAVTSESEKIIYQRGLAKIHLNPWGLWLKIYASHESYTGAVFVQVNQATIDHFGGFPWHFDFPVPPNWPGGAGDRKKILENRYIADVINNYHKQSQLVYS